MTKVGSISQSTDIQVIKKASGSLLGLSIVYAILAAMFFFEGSAGVSMRVMGAFFVAASTVCFGMTVASIALNYFSLSV